MEISSDILLRFREALYEYPHYSEIISLVQKNSSGHIRLIGSTVFGLLAYILYGGEKPTADFDFIVEYPVTTIELPEGYTLEQNRFGNYKIKNPRFIIDYVPLSTVYSIVSQNLEPTIDNYLTGVPLTVQSIAYDITENKIIGNIGIQAILDKVVAINNMHFAQYAAEKKGIPLQHMIQEKADKLGFSIL